MTDEHTCEICEVATELAEERTLHQQTIAKLEAAERSLQAVRDICDQAMSRIPQERTDAKAEARRVVRDYQLALLDGVEMAIEKVQGVLAAAGVGPVTPGTEAAHWTCWLHEDCSCTPAATPEQPETTEQETSQ